MPFPWDAYFCPISSQWGTADAEMKIPTVENPELTNGCSGVGQNIAMHAARYQKSPFYGDDPRI